MKSDLNKSTDRVLVFREGPYPTIGLVLAVLGLAGMYGTGSRLLLSWPNEASALLCGLVFCAGFATLGVNCLVRRQVSLDRSLQQMTRTSALSFWRRQSTQSFSGSTSVGWETLLDWDSSKYVIQLKAPERVIEVFQVHRMDDARSITREIGSFLDLKQEHWDEELLEAGGSPDFQSAKAIVRRVIWPMVGRQPMCCVFKTESRCAYSQSVHTILKMFSWFVGSMGLLLVLSPWLGVKARGMENVPWALPGIGVVFTVVAILFSFGCHGFTLDKQQMVASFWWKLGVPLLVTRRKLSAFSAVGVDRSMVEGPEHPHIVNRVVLSGASCNTLLLYQSIDSEETETLAAEIATFLKWSIVQLPQNQSQNRIGMRDQIQS